MCFIRFTCFPGMDNEGALCADTEYRFDSLVKHIPDVKRGVNLTEYTSLTFQLHRTTPWCKLRHRKWLYRIKSW